MTEILRSNIIYRLSQRLDRKHQSAVKVTIIFLAANQISQKSDNVEENKLESYLIIKKKTRTSQSIISILNALNNSCSIFSKHMTLLSRHVIIARLPLSSYKGKKVIAVY